MKKLSQRNQELISRGLKTCGLNGNLEAYYYIEESLYVDEAEKIHDFFKWLFQTNRPYGPANAQERWSEFMRGDKPPTEYFDLQYGWNGTHIIGGVSYANNAEFSERIKDPSLERVAKYMMRKNWELNYWFKIVNQDGKIVKEFTKAEVHKKAKALEKAGVKETTHSEMFENGYI